MDIQTIKKAIESKKAYNHLVNWALNKNCSISVFVDGEPEIEKSKDRVATLKRIQATTSQSLSTATFMYYLYITILLVLCFYVAYLVLKTSWGKGGLSTLTIVPAQ